MQIIFPIVLTNYGEHNINFKIFGVNLRRKVSGKSKVKVSKFKKQRRVGIELPGLGKPGALAKRNYPPGHHGQARRRPTEYSLRLTEKQSLVQI